MAKQEILDYIEAGRDELIALASKLISISSINNGLDYSQDNEKAVQEYIKNYMDKIGLETDMWAEDEASLRPNVVGTIRGSGGEKNLILNGHADVVPINEPEKWTHDAFSPCISDGKLFGRGASDMKGPLASCLFAAKALKACGVKLKGDLYVESVCGEESNQGSTIGSASVVRRGYKAPLAIIAEPTSLEIHTTSAGLMLFELTIPGKAVHASCRNQVIYPQHYGMESGPSVGVDALKKALPFIDLFYRLEDEFNFQWKHPVIGAGGHPSYDSQGVGTFIINPSIIQGGSYRAAVCGSVTITCYVLHPYTVPQEEVIKKIKTAIEAQAATDSWFDENPPILKLPVRPPWRPFYTASDHLGIAKLRESVTQVLGKQAVLSGFRAVCDATYITELGIPTVVFGPGNLSCGVHGDNEYIQIDEMVQAAKIYAAFVMDYCGTG